MNNSGTGSGVVSSNPAGINCGGTCNASFDHGKIVDLTASPFSGSVFDGWSGDSDCTDGRVTMDGHKTCTAIFNTQNVGGSKPNVPSNLRVVGFSNSALLEWTDNANNESSLKLDRRIGEAGGWSEVNSVAANTTQYEDTGLSFGLVYCYRIRATNSSGDSDPSNVSCGTTLETPILSSPQHGVSIASNSVTLSWSSINAANAYGVDVGRSCGDLSVRKNEPSATTTLALSNLQNGDYYWRVRAANTNILGVSAVSGCRLFTITSGSSSMATPVKIIAAGLNVRTGPDTSYSIITTGRADQRFVAFEKSGTWYHIYLPDANGASSGWINSFGTSSGTTFATEDPNATQIRVRDNITTGLNVRDGTGSSSGTLTKIWPGQHFVTFGSSSSNSGCNSSWIQIYLTDNANAPTGWVCSDFLTFP